MQGRKTCSRKLFYEVSLDQLVPEDHVVRRLSDILELRFIWILAPSSNFLFCRFDGLFVQESFLDCSLKYQRDLMMDGSFRGFRPYQVLGSRPHVLTAPVLEVFGSDPDSQIRQPTL